MGIREVKDSDGRTFQVNDADPRPVPKAWDAKAKAAKAPANKAAPAAASKSTDAAAPSS